MNKHFFKFLKINKKIIKKHSTSSKNIFLIDRGTYWPAFSMAIATAALNKKYKCNVLIFSEKNNSNIIKFYKSFGFEDYYFGLRYFFLITKLDIFISSIILSLNAIINIKIKNFTWFIRKFKVENICIGDLVYDEYIRFNHCYINPKIDLKFLKILFLTIFKTKNFLKFLKKYQPKLIFVTTSGKAGNVGIAIRVGIYKKIKIIELSANTKKQNNYILHDYSRLKYGRNRILQNKEKYREFKKYTEKSNNKTLNRFISKRSIALNELNKDKSKVKFILNVTSLPGQGNMRRFKDNISKKLFNRDQLLKKFSFKKNKITKIILIAPHAFSDAPHDNGLDMIFNDYYSHFKETVTYINTNIKNREILWLVKPHPASKHYKENGIVENFVKKLKNKNILICPKNISSHNLTLICDNAVTLRGTVGLEFACQGKYSITAGFASYSNLGFTLEPKNKDQYFYYLKNITNIPKLNKKQTLKAKKILYFFETKKQDNRLENSKVYSEFIDNNDKSFFCKKLIDNFKNMNSIENDPYYKDIANKFVV